MIEAFNNINNAVCGFLHINPYIQGVIILMCINIIAILGMAVLMGLVIMVFYMLSTKSAIDAVYKLASYTYGPILGMFAFGIFCKRKVHDRWVPLVAVAAPIICLILQTNSQRWFGGYTFSYELILINALLTILGLCALIKSKKDE